MLLRLTLTSSVRDGGPCPQPVVDKEEVGVCQYLFRQLQSPCWLLNSSMRVLASAARARAAPCARRGDRVGPRDGRGRGGGPGGPWSIRPARGSVHRVGDRLVERFSRSAAARMVEDSVDDKGDVDRPELRAIDLDEVRDEGDAHHIERLLKIHVPGDPPARGEHALGQRPIEHITGR